MGTGRMRQVVWQLVTALAVVTAVSMHGAAPSGAFTVVPETPVWDLAGVTGGMVTDTAGIGLDIAVDARGRVTGEGTVDLDTQSAMSRFYDGMRLIRQTGTVTCFNTGHVYSVTMDRFEWNVIGQVESLRLTASGGILRPSPQSIVAR